MGTAAAAVPPFPRVQAFKHLAGTHPQQTPCPFLGKHDLGKGIGNENPAFAVQHQGAKRQGIENGEEQFLIQECFTFMQDILRLPGRESFRGTGAGHSGGSLWFS